MHACMTDASAMSILTKLKYVLENRLYIYLRDNAFIIQNKFTILLL